MKPAPFEYLISDSLDEVIEWLSQAGDTAKVLAGGQSLVSAMNFRQVTPSVLIDLNNLTTLSYLQLAADGTLHIGAMTRQRQLELETAVLCPLLYETMPHIGRPQIRNRGTLGGSLAHAAPAAELPAVMVALDAELVARSGRGERQLSARHFFVGPYRTQLAADEILTEIIIPPPHSRTGTAFVEFSRQFSGLAVLGVAVVLALDEDTICRHVRLAYLNAHATTYDASATAQHLMLNEAYTPALLEEVTQTIAYQDLNPLGSLHGTSSYQRHLATVLTRQAFNTAASRSQGAAQ
ncbi:MAG: xanthine dehydrogenase family protein subunit M [Anaerolineales bacterium]|nr:xanthine dehydrogenase family protein subunit M [Anaerolineales bacterium]